MSDAKISLDIRDQVAQRYGQMAQGGGGCCGGGGDVASRSMAVGYSAEELAAVPEGTNLGLGCGSPTSLTLIEPGMTVVDLGSGAGIDCFLSAGKVGPSGRVIGVDMTDAMLEKARAHAREKGYANVEFRKGVIEALPLDDASVDLIISNCVINLSPDKPQVFREIARVLKPGGRMAVSDIVLLRPLPEALAKDVAAYVGCIAGADLMEDYLGHIRRAGLTIERAQRRGYDVLDILGSGPELDELRQSLPEDFDGQACIASLDLVAVKPGDEMRT